jgi:hypothetical protein
MATIDLIGKAIITITGPGVTIHQFSENIVGEFSASPVLLPSQAIHSERGYNQFIAFGKTPYGLPSLETHEFYIQVRKGSATAGSWGGHVREPGAFITTQGSAAWTEPGNWDDEDWGLTRLDPSLMTTDEKATVLLYMTPVADSAALGISSDIGSMFTLDPSVSQLTVVYGKPSKVAEMTGVQTLTAGMTGVQTLTASLTGLAGKV